MKYLFIFAHPDDETVACAGTIKKLTDQEDEVILVSMTAGDAGEVTTKAAQQKVKKLGSVAALRQQELDQVCQLLGVSEFRVLNFCDGEINNNLVWGELKEKIIDLIEEIKPDILVSFDHTGWYYHLDHVGVSVATSLAYHQTEYRPEALLLSHLHIPASRWNHYYVFPDLLRPTHRVDISQLMKIKLETLKVHDSQNLTAVKDHFEKNTHSEEYILAFASQKGKKMLTNHPVFEMVKS